MPVAGNNNNNISNGLLQQKRSPQINMGRLECIIHHSLTVLLVSLAVIGRSSAFIPPRSTTYIKLCTIQCKSSLVPEAISRTMSHTKIRGKVHPSRRKTTSIYLETLPSETEDASSSSTVIELQSNSTIQLESKSYLQAEEIPLDVLVEEQTDEQHMERVRMGDDVEELTHLLTHDEVDLQSLVSPSIPISYDIHGMVQADATLFAAGTILTNEMIAIEGRGVNGDTTTTATIVRSSDIQDYPPFITFLFQKDDNGQTLASKLFNLALLVASFGYVLVLIFNIDRGMTRGWSPGEIGMRIPLDTWASYENSLSEKPISTKTIINIVIYLLGDWLSQTIFLKKNILDFDAGRTLKNGFVGMCFGPAVHEYYEFSDYILPVDGVTIGITNRAFKILMDQTIYLSIKCSIYIMAIGVLNGVTVQDSTENVKNRIKPIMFTAWKFWPLVHCVTYGLIPARHRILWVNSVDLVWNAILASKARDDGDEGDENESGEGGLNENGKKEETYGALATNGAEGNI